MWVLVIKILEVLLDLIYLEVYLVGTRQIRINTSKMLKNEFLHENTMLTKRSRCSPIKIWTTRDLPTFHSQRYFSQALWGQTNLHFQRISMNYKADPAGICPRSRIRDIFPKHLKRISPQQKTDFMVNWYPNINNICWRM